MIIRRTKNFAKADYINLSEKGKKALKIERSRIAQAARELKKNVAPEEMENLKSAINSQKGKAVGRVVKKYGTKANPKNFLERAMKKIPKIAAVL